MNIATKIKDLRLIAFLLFFMGSFSIIGSLALSNYLHAFLYDYPQDYKKINLEDTPDSKEFILECNEDNKFCNNVKNKVISELTAPKLKNLGECFVYDVETHIIIDGKKFSYDEAMQFLYANELKGIIKSKYKNKKILYQKKVTNTKSKQCIKNSSVYNIYKIFPYWHNLMRHFNSVRKSGVKGEINPFFYGETSISNLVKRYPINLIFKTFLYISVVLMIVYWRIYNLLFQKILSKEKNNFYYFGIFSAICLFFHVLFLGMEIENDAFHKIRKIILLLFILSELLAQFFLTRGLRIYSNELIKHCFLNIIKLKVYFIYSLLGITSVVVLCLILYDVPKNVQYILEWNYFIVLLFYYLLSSVMWKKLVN